MVNSDLEKSSVHHLDFDNSRLSLANESEANDFSDIDVNKVLRKIDWNLLPLVSALYLLAFLDRGNIGNARIEGLAEDLNLSTRQYNLCLTIFFITYSTFEVPSNMLLKKIGKQSIYLPSIMFLWGIVMTFMGFTHNFAGLFAARFFLGVAEAGLYPGVAYCLTMYYCKGEMQFRQAIFYGAASVAGAFSGILAFAIGKMDGVGGKAGWAWIFILEGILTCLVSIVAFFKLPDYPDTAKFLTERERKFIIWRLRNDSNSNKDSENYAPDFNNFDDSHDHSLKKSLKLAFTDWQIYLHLLLYYGIIAPTYGISLFLPSVVKGLGYKAGAAQLMTVPIYVTASILSVVQAYFADRVGRRSPFIGSNLVIVIVGFTMAIVGQETGRPNVIYGGVYIAVCALYMSFPGIISWLSNNLANSRKRAIGMAIQIGLGNFGGAFASNFYKPGNYTLGHGLELGFATMGLLSLLVLYFNYTKINKRRERELKEGKYDGFTDEEFFKMGDRSPYYVYRT